ncbi:HDIG domain-containing protein [Trichothermofontia sichuanensis B231]|uniref:HD family phosphohydrolase n=1 Tax=Trichothermofontia sichuanensis TaxID=3045816 RepID=UPI002245025B|nr:HDIG domain-containing metalloprotein [Trichothermofontia sichuanensis]UZQ54411.1 HDIG domain-containing protein [Trichothermofontia sichuanensis B231]
MPHSIDHPIEVEITAEDTLAERGDARVKAPVTMPVRHGRRVSVWHYARPALALTVTVVTLTGAIGQRFYNQPRLAVGKVAPITLRARYDAHIEDRESTEAKRKEARLATAPVWMVNPTANQEISHKLQRLIEQGNTLRSQATPLPFVSPTILSTPTQVYLQQAEEWEWRAIQQAVDEIPLSFRTQAPPLASFSPLPSQPLLPPSENTSAQQRAIAELRVFQRTVSPPAFAQVINQVNQARHQYATALAAIAAATPPDTASPYDAVLLALTPEEWQTTQKALHQVARRMMTQGIPPGLPTSFLREAANLQFQEMVPPIAKPLAVRLLLSSLQPNLIEDKEQTRVRAEQAARAVEPVMVSIRRGEIIVQAAETITPAQFALLDHFDLSQRGLNWLGLLGFGGIVTIGVGLFWGLQRRFYPQLRRRDRFLLLLLCLSTPAFIALHLPSTNLAMVGLLVGSFYGSNLGVATVGLLSLLLPIGIELQWGYWLASAVSGLLAAFFAGRLRSREELALLGGVVGITQATTYLLVTFTLSAAAGTIWHSVLLDATIQGAKGVLWSIIALGLSPYLEHLFDLVTPVRLAELANPNRPLLKRLATEAPGTFQHTLFVATLAEAAACALGCNVELVRTGTLYHDIGKMHDPQGFIENQMGGPNKHDQLDDPWLSVAIIKKHVSEGLVMARRYRLPKAIRAFIPEHQGTMLVSYFYQQAQQRAGEFSAPSPDRPLDEAYFRYDGPIPQSKETGIVMLADSCEAALRSLKDATHEEALRMVNKILRARWQDNQLVDSGLSREDLAQIAEIFVFVWQQYNHKRIPYPKALSTQAPAIGTCP